MSIEFACPYCETVSSVPDAYAGKRGKCHSCRKVIEVPDPAEGDGPAPGPRPGTGRQGAGRGPAAGQAFGDPVKPPSDLEAMYVRSNDAGEPGSDTKPCPYCGEGIKRVAKKCKYCGEFLDRRLRPTGGSASRVTLASPWTRLAAHIIDNLLYLPIVLIIAFPAGVLVVESQKGGRPNPILGLLIILGCAGLFVLTAYQWYLTATRGATLGKGWLGIKILTIHGTEVDFLTGVVMRNWVIGFGQVLLGMVSMGWLLGLVDSLMIFSADRRCLHDHIAKTQVIETASQRRAPPRRPPGVRPPVTGGPLGRRRGTARP